jgi:hypothetical protein
MAGQTIQLESGWVHLSYADGFGSVEINGRKWCWSFHEYGGPLWLRADGTTERKCQTPTSKAVWAAFEEWHRRYVAARKKTPRTETVEIEL